MSLIVGNRVSRRGNLVPTPQPAAGALVLSTRRRRNRAGRAANTIGANQMALAPRALVQVLPSAGRRRRNRGARRLNNPLGMGLSAPSTFGTAMTGGAPMMRASAERGGCIVSHSEIVLSPNGTNGFSLDRIAMVPNVFSWLNGLGQNWSRYRWLNLRADYVTASPTSQGGTIAMGATYDVPGETPNSIAEMKALAHSFVGPVWQQSGSIAHSVQYDSNRWSKPWYSYSAGPASLPISYIPAFLLFGKQTQVNGQLIGHLVVTYTIEFLDPIPSRINTLVSNTIETGGELIVSTEPSEDTEAPESELHVLMRGLKLLVDRANQEDEESDEEDPPNPNNTAEADVGRILEGDEVE